MLGLVSAGLATTSASAGRVVSDMTRDERSAGRGAVTLFLCGDVMTGRGIDQVLPHPVHPRLYEPYVRSAVDYVTLAERENGPIPRGVAFDYVWGDALTELGRIAPDLRIINLETAVTTSETPWPRKGIHYRMHPRNIPCLNAAGIDACVLANNHVLDWGRAGLEETLTTLRQAGVETVGAGGDLASASAPRVLGFSGGGRLLVYACAHPSSGVPPGWEAGAGRPGVSLLGAFSPEAVERIGREIAAVRRPGDRVLVSLHWGGNWGYRISSEHRRFAHWLIDEAAVDIVHGHSSHHPKGIEIYKERPIFYGCGDFLNDYEGIGGHEAYRSDLTLMYFPTLDRCTGRLLRLVLTPLRIRRFRLHYPSERERAWLLQTLQRECGPLGALVKSAGDGRFEVTW